MLLCLPIATDVKKLDMTSTQCRHVVLEDILADFVAVPGPSCDKGTGCLHCAKIHTHLRSLQSFNMFHLAKNLYEYCKAKRNREISLVLVGLPNAGKSTIKEVLGGNLSPLTVPTIGVTKPIKLKIGMYQVTIYDLGGGVKDLWKNYYHEIHGAIWVVDAADVEQLAVSKDCLMEDAQHEMLKGKPILVFANKQDLPGALAPADLALKMGLESLTSSSNNVMKCTAIPVNGADPNLLAGIKWVVDRINTEYASLSQRVDQAVHAETAKRASEKAAREERVAKLKEERRKAKEAQESAEANGSNPIKAKAPAASVSFPCTVTSKTKSELHCEPCGDGLFKCSNAAVKKSSLWGWKAVCAQCDEFLKAKKAEETAKAMEENQATETENGSKDSEKEEKAVEQTNPMASSEPTE